jgi:hypothetical protein
MFVRVRRKCNRLAFSIVSSSRRNGKVRQETHLSLGTVAAPYTDEKGRLLNENDFRDFWYKARDRVRNWKKRNWGLISLGIDNYLPRSARSGFFVRATKKEAMARTIASMQKSQERKRKRKRQAIAKSAAP